MFAWATSARSRRCQTNVCSALGQPRRKPQKFVELNADDMKAGACAFVATCQGPCPVPVALPCQDPDWYMKDQISGGPGYLTKKRVSDDVSMCPGKQAVSLQQMFVCSVCACFLATANCLTCFGGCAQFLPRRQVRWARLEADHACQPQPRTKEETPNQLAL